MTATRRPGSSSSPLANERRRRPEAHIDPSKADGEEPTMARYAQEDQPPGHLCERAEDVRGLCSAVGTVTLRFLHRGPCDACGEAGALTNCALTVARSGSP